MNNIYTSTKYIKWYFGIILNAKTRIFDPTQYYEKHHITPRSLGGKNDLDNLVKLTAREHFICHQLLIRMTTGRDQYKMVYANWLMCNGNQGTNKRYNITSRTYDFLRKQFSIAHKEFKHTEETRKKISEKVNLAITDEYRKNASKRSSGKNNWMYGKTHSAEIRKTISEKGQGRPGPNLGKPMSLSAIEKQKKTKMSKPIVECPHCSLKGREGGGIQRWHFNNCKMKS